MLTFDERMDNLEAGLVLMYNTLYASDEGEMAPTQDEIDAILDDIFEDTIKPLERRIDSLTSTVEIIQNILESIQKAQR